MPKEYYTAMADIEEIIAYGDSGRYVDWVAFLNFEANMIDNINAGNYGKYYEVVSKLYYKIKDDLREVLKKAGILH